MAGTSNYPGGIDDFALNSPEDLGDVDAKGRTHSKRHDDIEAAVTAIETELGVNPSGSSSTVADRFGVVDQSASAAASSAAAAANSAAAAANSAAVIDAYESLPVEFRQFGADGSVLRNLATRVNPAEVLLKQAVWWIDSAHSSATGQAVTNLGWGGAALNAQLGSTGTADSNDPKFLDWDGESYVYLPGVASNCLSVPDAAALDITGDIDIRVRVAMDDWTPAATSTLLSKMVTAGNQRSWRLQVLTTGVLRFVWSADGSTSVIKDSTVATGITDGSVKWIRATLDVDNGSTQNEVKFYTSDDGSSWTQLGATVTTAGVTSIYLSSAPMLVGAYDTVTDPATAKVYRAQILNGINGTPVLDIDTSVLTSGSQTSFTALTGQTVTINRSTSGRKSVAVTHPCWLFGTDDYLEVPDSGLIDFGASDSFTVLAVVRQWATQPTSSIISKKDSLGFTAGYALYFVSPNDAFLIADGTFAPSRTAAPTLGSTATVVGVRDTAADTLQFFYNGTGTATTTDTTTGTLANAHTLRVGRLSAGSTSYADMEFVAAAIFRRALTSTEIALLSNYYSARIGA